MLLALSDLFVYSHILLLGLYFFKQINDDDDDDDVV